MSNATVEAVPAEAAPAKVKAPWGILALLTVGVLIAFFDRSSISAASSARHSSGPTP